MHLTVILVTICLLIIFSVNQFSYLSYLVKPSDLVEFVFQHAGIQAQLVKAALLHRLNYAVHLCVVFGRQVGEVDVRRDELFAQHTCV